MQALSHPIVGSIWQHNFMPFMQKDNVQNSFEDPKHHLKDLSSREVNFCHHLENVEIALKNLRCFCFCCSVKRWVAIFWNPRSAVMMDWALSKLILIWSAISPIFKRRSSSRRHWTTAVFCSFLLVQELWAWSLFSTYVCLCKIIMCHLYTWVFFRQVSSNCASSLWTILADSTPSCVKNFIIIKHCSAEGEPFPLLLWC
jgi:hypothetical protein